MLKFLYILLILLPVLIINAQTPYVVSGYIIDRNTNIPLSPVHIKVKGKLKGVISDKNGFYTITLYKSPVKLEFSHTSYQTKTIPVKTKKNKRIDITLKEKINIIDEAVVEAKKKPVNLVAKKLYDVSDYEFMGDNLLLFA